MKARSLGPTVFLIEKQVPTAPRKIQSES